MERTKLRHAHQNLAEQLQVKIFVYMHAVLIHGLFFVAVILAADKQSNETVQNEMQAHEQ